MPQREQPYISPLTQNRSGSRTNTRSYVALPMAVRLIALTLFLPEELSFYIDNLRLTPTRLILLLLTPTLLFRLCKMCSAGRREILVSDILILITSMWMFCAVAIVAGINEALAHAAPDILEFCISYFAVRVLLTDHGEALSFINLLCLVIAIVAVIGLLDTATSTYFTHDLFAKLTGYVKNRQHDYRQGFLRATSTLEHPIHFGAACSFGLVLAMGPQISSAKFQNCRMYSWFSCSYIVRSNPICTARNWPASIRSNAGEISISLARSDRGCDNRDVSDFCRFQLADRLY